MALISSTLQDLEQTGHGVHALRSTRSTRCLSWNRSLVCHGVIHQVRDPVSDLDLVRHGFEYGEKMKKAHSVHCFIIIFSMKITKSEGIFMYFPFSDRAIWWGEVPLWLLCDTSSKKNLWLPYPLVMFAGLDGLDSTRRSWYTRNTRHMAARYIRQKSINPIPETSQFHKWKTPKNQQQATTPAAQLPVPLLSRKLLAATSHALATLWVL